MLFLLIEVIQDWDQFFGFVSTQRTHIRLTYPEEQHDDKGNAD
ncbi:Uncharacterised protein [Vibrio cholerae]|nr:Uncharacterised protein [Vibrio cholerae]